MQSIIKPSRWRKTSGRFLLREVEERCIFGRTLGVHLWAVWFLNTSTMQTMFWIWTNFYYLLSLIIAACGPEVRCRKYRLLLATTFTENIACFWSKNSEGWLFFSQTSQLCWLRIYRCWSKMNIMEPPLPPQPYSSEICILILACSLSFLSSLFIAYVFPVHLHYFDSRQ